MSQPGGPVLFVHGLWLHPTSWGQWEDFFRDAGHSPLAPGWPGVSDTVEETRRNPAKVAGKGIEDVVQHYARIIRDLNTPPIVIGHSFGGLIAQRLLADGRAVAGVAIDPAPIKGIYFLPPSALRVASIALRNPGNRNGSVMLTPEQWRYGFTNALTEEESNELYERVAVPSPGKPLFEAAFANVHPGSPAGVDTDKSDRGPLLVTSGGKDHTVPRAVSRATVRRYHKSMAITDYRDFPDRGHSLTVDSGWREVADAVLDWLKANELN